MAEVMCRGADHSCTNPTQLDHHKSWLIVISLTFSPIMLFDLSYVIKVLQLQWMLTLNSSISGTIDLRPLGFVLWLCRMCVRAFCFYSLYSFSYLLNCAVCSDKDVSCLVRPLPPPHCPVTGPAELYR